MALIGYLQVTRKCNQACVFCSNPENDNILSLDDAQRAVRELRDKAFDGVILTGGEPTLYGSLADLIRYCRDVGLAPRIISNGQKLADRAFLQELVLAGLSHVHLSLHSCRPETQAELTGNRESLPNLVLALGHCASLGVSVNINTVINRRNADHLDETVSWLVERFPFLRHFVWNNLDPHMNRVAQHAEVIPQFQDFELALHRACRFLRATARTFRVERVPLCYMAEFAECSTETRKIVKAEKRDIYFLDARQMYSQGDFFYEKDAVCRECTVAAAGRRTSAGGGYDLPFEPARRASTIACRRSSGIV
jgi:MoaA/NifB/PqqE/SkfB family radical SAM enzyme